MVLAIREKGKENLLGYNIYMCPISFNYHSF